MGIIESTTGTSKSAQNNDHHIFLYTGGYYSLPIDAGTSLDAVVLNTNLYYDSNKEVNGTGDPAGQFAWLDQLLREKAAQDRKVMSIP